MTLRSALWLFLLFLIGCGRTEIASIPSEAIQSAPPEISPSLQSAGQMPQKDQGLPKVESLQRKIIYTASAQLVVEDFTGIPERIESLVKKFSGYVAQKTILGSPGSPRSGRWTIRVPVEQYDGLLAEVQRLGEVRTVSSRSEDVSEEYYDVQARVRNLKKQEERLLKLLETATGKLEEVLRVENELARVRGEIERLEGRVRMLDSLAAMSTLELSVEELQRYKPGEAPTYLTQVRRAWVGSLDRLASTAQGVSIALVAIAPWFVALWIVLVIPWSLVKRWRRRNR